MPYISPEQIKELQKIDLLTYLQNYEPNELVHESGDNYCTRSHDSLKISNGLWNWFSKGIGGNMISTIAYYLASPLNLLCLFFKDINSH